MLTSLTIETIGQEPVTYSFDYQAPALHSAGLFLVGFGGVTRTGAAHTWSEEFLNSDAWSGLRLAGRRHDVNSPFADSFDKNEFEDVAYQGIPWKRLKATVSGVQSPDGTQVASERTDFLDYESEVCARTVERTGAAGKLRTVNSRVQVSGLGAALHCLPSRIDLTGFRPDGAEDFSCSGVFDRNSIGQVTRLTSLAPVDALTPADALTLQTITYTPDFSVSSMTLAGTGSARFVYDGATRLLNEIDSPDGVVTKVLDRDPLTDAVRTLQVDRGGIPYQQYFRFDDFERLVKRWSNIGGTSEASPSEMLSYRLASGTLPATIFASELVDPASGSARSSVDYYTGGGAPITSAIPDGWTFGAVTERLPALRQTNAYLRGPLPASSSPLDLDYAALLAPGTATKVRQEVGTIHAHKASSTTVVQTGVERQLATTLKVVGGLLEETTTENGSLTTTRTLDAAGRLVAYRDEAGTTYRFSYDAMGRTREVVLPDGTRHTQVFDGHGRVTEVAREGVATIRFS